MAVVNAQTVLGSTSTSPVLLFTSTGEHVVNVRCVNPSTEAVTMFLEQRLSGSTGQEPEQLLVPGSECPIADRILEGPIYLGNGDTLYVYAGSTAATFAMGGHTL